jgi:hypothetical protein
MGEMGLEAPDADAAEQEQEAVPAAGDNRDRAELPLEASQADSAEQALEVSLDDDEYR